MRTESVQDPVRTKFVFLAQELNRRFPELDLRFNLQGGTQRLRFMAAAVSRDVVELELDDFDTQSLLHAATFQIKEMAQLFDD